MNKLQWNDVTWYRDEPPFIPEAYGIDFEAGYGVVLHRSGAYDNEWLVTASCVGMRNELLGCVTTDVEVAKKCAIDMVLARVAKIKEMEAAILEAGYKPNPECMDF